MGWGKGWRGCWKRVERGMGWRRGMMGRRKRLVLWFVRGPHEYEEELVG